MGEGGDKKAAGGAIVGFTKTYTGSYHFYEATEVAGDLAMSSGSYAFASTQYGVIANKATKWPEMQMRARLADGRCLFAQKKYDEAKARFDEVLSTDNSAPNLASYKIMAEVGKASCLAETGKPDEAIKALELILEKNDPADAPLFSRTYVALGNALVKANKPKDAIMAFLAVELLYYGEADAYAESLYNLSKLWDKENRADRALAARNMLKERFGGTPWASQN
jgi:tetratricopeptide (TPR) repeat protein